MRATLHAAAAATALALAPPAVLAAEEPLWEAGIGVAGLHFPDYRGSSESRNYALPAPYLVYRGDIVKADRNGLRGMFYRNDRLDLHLSAGASLPVDSSENKAREGMADLKPSVELGPALDVTLWRSDNRRTKLDLRFPLRGAVTVESSPRFIGGQFFPHVNVDFADPLGFPGWNLGVLGGAVYTDRRYNRYFYAVQPEEARPGRPAYDPPGGYAGAQFLVAVSKRFPKYWIGAFARYDTLHGAAFESSPLVTSKGYFAAGIAIAWMLGESKERVTVDEFGSR